MRFSLSILSSLSIIFTLSFPYQTALGLNSSIARVENVIDQYFGVKVNDPYRYMENLNDPEVKKWIKDQADITENTLSKLPARQELLSRLQQLDAGKPFSVRRINRLADGTILYKKRYTGENLYKLYLRNKAGKEKLLIDPAMVSTKEGEHYSLMKYNASLKSGYIVYGLAKNGSEETIYHIKDIASGKNLPETIDRIETAYNRPHWLPDGSGFFYSRRQLLPDDAAENEIYDNTKVYFHRLNTPAEQDRLIAGNNLSDLMALSKQDYPSMYIPPASKHAIVKIKHGDSNELTLYTAPINSLLLKDIPWKKICDVKDEVTQYTVHGDNIFLQSASNAPRFKIIKTSLVHPDMSKAKTVIAESQAVIINIKSSSKALYSIVIDGGFERILRMNYDGKEQSQTLQLPGKASGWITAVSPDQQDILIRTNSWTKGDVVYAYHEDDNSFSETDFLSKGRFDDLDDYKSVEVKVKSHDGVMVPLSIIYKKGIKLNGRNPLLISGYGAYGSISYVHFNPLNIAWLEKGGILAIAHIRGGGEYGKAWHMAGQKLTKPNTWKDFIACAEYLIEKGYTSHDFIAGQGGSAGGITIGRAIIERADLFKAAVINVGALDSIRAETTANGAPNIAEFGTVKKEDEFDALLEMSSYHQVRNGVNYPAVLLVHGMNDHRVEPWNSAKMTARLQAATTSNNPVLFRVEYSAGHGIGSTRQQYLKQLADEWAFLLWQFSKGK